MYEYKIIDCSKLLDDEIFAEKLNDICEERKLRISKLKNKKAMVESLGASIALEDLLGALNIHGPLIFTYGKTGKPYLENKFSDGRRVFISFTHKFPMAGAVVSDRPVGIDIEKIADFKEGISERFFTKKDCEYIDGAADEQERRLRFFKVWTFKEAYCKARDISLNENLDKLDYDEKKVEHFLMEEYLISISVEEV